MLGNCFQRHAVPRMFLFSRGDLFLTWATQLPVAPPQKGEGGEIRLSPPSVSLLADEPRSKSISRLSAKPKKEQWEIFLPMRRVTTSVMKIEPLSVMLYSFRQTTPYDCFFSHNFSLLLR